MFTFFQDAFEKKFLSATEKLYSAEGQKLINDLPVPGYLGHVGQFDKNDLMRSL